MNLVRNFKLVAHNTKKSFSCTCENEPAGNQDQWILMRILCLLLITESMLLPLPPWFASFRLLLSTKPRPLLATASFSSKDAFLTVLRDVTLWNRSNPAASQDCDTPTVVEYFFWKIIHSTCVRGSTSKLLASLSLLSTDRWGYARTNTDSQRSLSSRLRSTPTLRTHQLRGSWSGFPLSSSFSDPNVSVALLPQSHTSPVVSAAERDESQRGHQACIMPCWTAIRRTLRRRAGCQRKQRVASLWSSFYACWAPLNNHDPSCHPSNLNPTKL